MEIMKHTPVPWNSVCSPELGALVRDKNNLIIAKMRYLDGVDYKANAKRIVECVNALEGIEGEQMLNLVIESKKYQEIKEVLENMIEHLDQGRVLTLRKDSIIIEALRNSINK